MKQEEKISPIQPTKANNGADTYPFAPHAKKLSAIIDADAEQARKRVHRSIRAELPIAGVIIA
ncbi:MAG: hypothetical protein O0X96_05630 [Methanocorpusculum sp.]|nr:hypothetical protein [Methanocorpusculum sp.]MDE2524591.1 hypothetical protein [Methanocorpusculum sp.]